MFGFEDDWLLTRILFLIPLILCLGVHEWAHAWAAWKLGDDTAARLDRLTLNPLAHIDPIGTLVLPLLGVPFGWAKPVPFNPSRFNRRVSLKMGTMLVAAAGPISNILMALACVVLVVVVKFFDPLLLAKLPALQQLVETLILLNVLLAVFNLIPLPPLDGSHIAEAFMPRILRPCWDAIASLGLAGLLIILFLPSFFGVNIFYWPIRLTQTLIRIVV